MKIKIVIVTLLLFSSNLFAQISPTDKRTYYAQRINQSAPEIDGLLDDEVWQNGNWSGEFVQRDPVEGDPPSFNTYFNLCYDDNNLYVGIRVLDPDPSLIEKRGSRRDQEDGDWIKIGFDSYDDDRTAFVFTLTAAGVKGDYVISEDGTGEDKTWDPVWYGHVSQNDEGWLAEMKIPLNQLRYSGRSGQSWGLQLERLIYRKGESSFWQFFSKDEPGVVSRFGNLSGLENLSQSRRIELLPYIKSDYATSLKILNNPFADGTDTDLLTGLDGKIGLTSDLTVNFTFNPDFGQVEADPSEVNLTAFETFFDERRPFFIEGKDILNYHINSGSFRSRENIFYSRRIGQAPNYSLPDQPGMYVDNPLKTNIIAAVKLTGKTSNGVSIGIIEAVTNKEEAEIDVAGKRSKVTTEPLTNYFAGRIQKDFRQGDTRFGLMFTSVNRNIYESHLKFLNKSAYTGGFDFVNNWANKTYFVSLMTVFSSIHGDKEAILRAQKASARYFQRPNAGHLNLDPNATSLSGHGGTFNVGKAGTGHFKYSALTTWRSPGLELNDIGFLREADYLSNTFNFEYWEYNPIGFLRNFNMRLKQHHIWDFDMVDVYKGGDITNGWDIHSDVNFTNYWGIKWGLHRFTGEFDKNKLRGGPYFLNPSIWHRHFEISTDTRKKFHAKITTIYDKADEGIFSRIQHRPSVTYRPNSQFSFSVDGNYIKEKTDLQYITTTDFINAFAPPVYVFGDIHQKTLGLVFRANYSITPNMTIEYYGQPFVSAGDYSRFKKITNQGASIYEDRYRVFDDNEISYDSSSRTYTVNDNGAIFFFPDRDFNFNEFRSNMVFRWEYKPGSTIFLVWTQNRSMTGSLGEFSYNDDLDNLFNVHPDNVFLVKFNHWFSF